MKNSIKTVLLIVILSLIVIISGITIINYLSNSAQILQKDIEAAGAAVKNLQWAEASQQLTAFENKWDSAKTKWAILLDHFEIDNIDNSFIKSKKYIESEDFPLALSELESLRHYLEHIPLKEKFTFENIL